MRPLRGQGRIVGGEKSKFGDWPWQVLVKESTWLGLFTKNKCGGVLISDRHVLTAAHCQPGFLASLLVELGEYDISGPNEFMSTKEQKVCCLSGLRTQDLGNLWWVPIHYVTI